MNNENGKNCAYERLCKGVCKDPSSCIKHGKTEEEYWQEIKDAMVAKAKLEMLKHLLEANKNITSDWIIKYLKLGGEKMIWNQ